MDYRSFKRSTLWAMREIAWANLNVVLPEERQFWTAKLNLINAVLETNHYEDFDLSRTVSGTGRSAPLAPDPDDAPRDLQARDAKVDPSYGTARRALNGKTSSGLEELKRLRRTASKVAQKRQLE